MRAINVKCPECGASLSAAPHATTTSCQYCGTTSQIQRRSRYLEVPIQPARSDAPMHLPVAVQKHSANWIIFVILGATLFAGGIPALCVYRAVSKERAQRNAPKWSGLGGVAVSDLNGDGILDPIGRIRSVIKDVIYMAAFDGKTGKRMWKSQALGKGRNFTHTPMALADGFAAVADDRAQLVGLSLEDGSTAWTIRLNEKIEKLCRSEVKGTLVAATADKRFHQVNLAAGAITATASMTRCVPLPGDGKEGNPETLVYKWHGEYADLIPRRKIPGFSADSAIHHIPTGITIGLGHKHPGSRIPTIVSYRWPPEVENDDSELSQRAAREKMRAAKTREERHAAIASLRQALARQRRQRARIPEKLWLAQVPGIDPMTVRETSVKPEHIDINGAQVIVVYELRASNTYRLAGFDAESGKRLWDVSLPGDRPFSAVRATPTHAMVSRWGGLHVYDIKTGAHAYTIH